VSLNRKQALSFRMRLRIEFLLFFCLSVNAEEHIQTDYPYKECFESAGRLYKISPRFLASVASVESSLNPKAVSGSDAIGLMQIRWPTTALELGIGSRDQLFDPCSNIKAGAKYLNQLVSRFGSRMLALAAYHIGPTEVSAVEAIPKSTLNYIEKIYQEEELLAHSSSLADLGSCQMESLIELTAKVHQPKQRQIEVINWLTKMQKFCSISTLTGFKNRLPELMGTADADGKVGRLLDRILALKVNL
jgi:hypothetical protein